MNLIIVITFNLKKQMDNNEKNEQLNIGVVSGCLLTPRQVADKFTKEWAEKRILEYSKCYSSQILAWGYRQGYEEARKDLLNER